MDPTARLGQCVKVPTLMMTAYCFIVGCFALGGRTGQTDPPTSRPGTGLIAIVGTIIDADGNLAAQFPLELRKAANPGEGRDRTIVKTSTEKDGSFIFADVPLHQRYSLVGGTNELGWIFERVYGESSMKIDLGKLRAVRMDPRHRPR
jgi:hypothetical protein